MISVYVASKLSKSSFWKDLRNKWPEVHFTARWVFLHVGTVPDEACYAKVFWQHDLADVIKADVVLVWATEGEHLRGALVEAGMAIALGKSVIVVGEHPDYGTWQYHPQVYKTKDFDEARMLLQTMAM